MDGLAGGVDPERVAEIIVKGPAGRERRGSGYRLAHDVVITAAHVVAGSTEVSVRFNARRADGWTSPATVAFHSTGSGVDLALLDIEPRPDEPPVRAVPFGRVPDSDVVFRVTAMGFPRFKLRTQDSTYRDSHHLRGEISALSNRKQGTLEITAEPPERDVDPPHSPWEGMSGAAVFASEHLVGLVNEHHRPDGLGRLTATRVDRWTEVLADAELARLREIVPTLDAVPIAVSASRRRAGVATPPGVPSMYVDRPQERAALVAEIVRGDAVHEMRIIGLVGMTGSGKSVLARAIVADDRVARRFGDRVVWLDIGRQPDLIRAQARLAEAFGHTRPITRVEQGLDELRGLLAGSPCLIVLDNVWQTDVLRAFDFRDPEITLLVTTRSRAALFADVSAHNVGPVDRAQARQVLARYAGVDVSELPPEADQIAAICGDLVLALAIMGGMVAEGRDWDRVLGRLRRADLSRLGTALRDYPYDTLLRAIEASVADLSAGQRSRLLELGVFGEPAAVASAAAERLWGLSGMDTEDAEDLLIFLDRRSLIRWDRAEHTFSVHDMIAAYVRSQLDPVAAQELHSRLADSFLDGWGGMDNQLPGLRELRDSADDRYGVDQVAAHLTAAERFADVDRLFALERTDGTGQATNVWYAAHERLGLTAAYQGDVRRAWARAADFAAEIRYALITASIASIASNLPAQLVTRLVEVGLWSARQALAFVEAMPDGRARSEVLHALVSVLPTESVHQVVGIASILAPPDRAAILTAAVAVDGDLFARAAAAVEDVVDLNERAEAAANLADVAPAFRDAALATAESIPTPWDQAIALGRLAASEPSVVARAWQAALVADDDPYWLARAQANLIPLLPKEELTTVRVLAEANPDRAGRALLLVSVASLVHDEGWFDDCVCAIGAVRNDPYLQATLFTTLVEGLPEELVDEALAAVSRISDHAARAYALAGMLPHLPAAARQSVSVTVVELADGMDRDAVGRAEVLTSVAASLEPDERAGVLASVLRAIPLIADPTLQSRAFQQVVPLLPVEMADAAVAAAQSITDLFNRAGMLTALSQVVAPERANQLLLDALLVARTVRCEPWLRPVATVALATKLPAEEGDTLINAALAEIESLDNDAMRQHALDMLLRYLPSSPVEEPQEEVLDVEVSVESVCAELAARQAPPEVTAIVTRIGRHLTAEQLRWAWEWAGFADTPTWIVTLAAEVVAVLPDEETTVLHADLEALVDAMPTVDVQLDLLVAIALGFRASDAAAAALDAITVILDSARQVDAFARLMPELAPELLATALEATQYVTDPYDRAEALAQVSQHLGAEQLPRALELAAEIDLLDGRPLVVAEIALTALRTGAADHERYVRAALEGAATAGRETALNALITLADQCVASADSARRVLTAIDDTERWWPTGTSTIAWLAAPTPEQPSTSLRTPDGEAQVFVPGLAAGDAVTLWDEHAMTARLVFTERLLALYPSRRHIPATPRIEQLPSRLWSASGWALEQLRESVSDRWYGGHYVDAVDGLSMLIKAYPSESNWQNYRGQIFSDLGYATLAIRDLDNAMSLNPTGEVHAYALSARGYAYGTLGAYDQAFLDFEQSLREAPGNAWTFLRRGLLRWALGLPEAEDDIRAALEKSKPPLNGLQAQKAQWMLVRCFPSD